MWQVSPIEPQTAYIWQWGNKYAKTNGMLSHFTCQGSTKSFPHLLFSGQSGSGKKTRISAFLRELFGPQAQKLKLEEKDFGVFLSYLIF